MKLLRAVLALLLMIGYMGMIMPVGVLAQEPSENFTINPLVVTEKGKPRDILKHSLTLTNTTSKKLSLYADVFDFDPSKGAKVMDTNPHSDRSKNLANWIEITRGKITLKPNETIQVPYLIHINLRSNPGVYHAEITFSEGNTRQKATETPKSRGSVMINLEVQDDARERLHLGTFLADKNVFSGNTASFSYAVENVGNRTLTPRGNIRIYDRVGKEVATIPVNGDSESISPNGNNQLAAVWNAEGRFGKYKAFLDLEYGQTGAVQDTVYFWVFPWREVLIGFILLLILAASITYLIHIRLTYNKYGYAGIAGAQVATQEVPIDDEEEFDEPGTMPPQPTQPARNVVMPSTTLRKAPPQPAPQPMQTHVPAQPGGTPQGKQSVTLGPRRINAVANREPTALAGRQPMAPAPTQQTVARIPQKNTNQSAQHVVTLSNKRR